MVIILSRINLIILKLTTLNHLAYYFDSWSSLIRINWILWVEKIKLKVKNWKNWSWQLKGLSYFHNLTVTYAGIVEWTKK